MNDPISENSAEESAGFLRRVSLFSGLEEEGLIEIAKKLKSLSLPKGSILYNEGDRGDALYIIRSGRVRIFTYEEGGKERVLNYLGRGDAFGETALLTGAARSVTVKTDSHVDFFVLYMNDFEALLKKNPSVSFYLSRLLSQRLLFATKQYAKKPPKSELLGFFASLKKEDWIVFMANMGLALSEQTRRKVLLLDLSPHAAALIKSAGLKSPLASPSMLKADDLRNPEFLERLITVHPSGVGIIPLSEEVFSKILLHSISPFMETLRGLYDFVIVGINIEEFPRSNPGRLSDIHRALFLECDSLFCVSSGEPIRLEYLKFRLQEIESENGVTARMIFLGERSLFAGPGADFVIPWGDSVTDCLRKGDPPFLASRDGEAVIWMMGRIARFIGKIQVGLAMGSGAAYGYTIVGIMKVFEREKIPVDFIAGSSMGALLGSFFAMGKTAEEVELITHSITKRWMRMNILGDLNMPWPHGGLLLGATISRFLKTILGKREFKDLLTPFACVATDIMTGKPVILKEGKVWESVRASISLPLIFRPYKMGNHFLVDGGLVNPVPASLLSPMGADILVSVNLTSDMSRERILRRKTDIFPDKSPGIINIFFRMLYTMQCQVASAPDGLSHVIIHPDTRNFSWVDFHRAEEIIPLGEEAAQKSINKIKSALPFFSGAGTQKSYKGYF